MEDCTKRVPDLRKSQQLYNAYISLRGYTSLEVKN